jgi:hypothetical protein
MTKADLIKALEIVPDDAIAIYFSGDETLEYATQIQVHYPSDKYYYIPKGRKKITWFELGGRL